MDLESIKAVHSSSAIFEQHFDGGYYSPTVREQWDAVKDRSEEEKLALYADTFNQAWASAESLIASGRFSLMEGGLDLTKEGLGVITIDLEEVENVPGSNPEPYKSLYVGVNSFEPIQDVGLVDAQLVYGNEHPKGWQEPIFATPEGQLPSDIVAEVDSHLLRALDYRETLQSAQKVVEGAETTLNLAESRRVFEIMETGAPAEVEGSNIYDLGDGLAAKVGYINNNIELDPEIGPVALMLELNDKKQGASIGVIVQAEEALFAREAPQTEEGYTKERIQTNAFSKVADAISDLAPVEASDAGGIMWDASVISPKKAGVDRESIRQLIAYLTAHD